MRLSVLPVVCGSAAVVSTRHFAVSVDHERTLAPLTTLVLALPTASFTSSLATAAVGAGTVGPLCTSALTQRPFLYLANKYIRRILSQQVHWPFSA